MKQRLLIFITLGLLVVLLVGLNAVSYVQRVKEPDREFEPNRSTFHTGATGSQAYYSLLAETGHQVMRWQRSPADLVIETRTPPSTFIVIGPLRRQFTDEEQQRLLEWVAAGGRLVLIDREPDPDFLSTTAEWSISVATKTDVALMTVDPADRVQMTAETAAVRPIQPTPYTSAVNAIQPSRFASSVTLKRFGEADISEFVEVDDTAADSGEAEPEPTPERFTVLQQDEDAPPPPKIADSGDANESLSSEPGHGSPTPIPPPPPPSMPPTTSDAEQVTVDESEEQEEYRSTVGPGIHFASPDRNVLVDLPYGAGSITVLTDPYIVSNGGIAAVDNAQLAVNLAAARDGLIAFDEYHHGFGSENNRVFEYFSGTPFVAILLQFFAIAALVLFSRSRRFARPVPEPEPDRLSKLEYVSAMAELQQRTAAFDLAMENILGDFRRRVSRHFGVDGSMTGPRELAELISGRTSLAADDTQQLLEKCQAIAHGEPTSKKEAVRLAGRLREIENELRLTRGGQRRI